MSSNEMRKDYLLDRWVVIASQRRLRPTDFIKPKDETKPSPCPFCPGNEQMTPPATLVYLQRNGTIIKAKDDNNIRQRNWLVRCVPNLYLAFTLPTNSSITTNEALFESMPAMGHHEVLIESPKHDAHPSTLQIAQLVHIIHAYQDRVTAFYSEDHVKYVSIFRNHGLDAGASLTHAHTQIIATPIIPHIPQEELERNTNFWNSTGRCLFCNIIKKEADGPRQIYSNEDFIVFTPWASVHPYEFWIFPKRHLSTILEMTESEVHRLAITLRACFSSLRTLINDPSYNFGIHMIPTNKYHWHIEVYPRLTVWAGFEKSTGMFINIILPEDAALSLREAIKDERVEG